MSTPSALPVPHLTTALKGPLLDLERQLLSQQVNIEGWLREQWRQTPPPFYSSVDLRNSGFKVAPVDTNLFPAGFNNLNPEFMSLCIQAVQATMMEICPDAKRILIIPESHTRNAFYFENLAILKEVLIKAGFSVRIGSLLSELDAPKTINLASGRELIIEPLIRRDKRVGVEEFFPCAILLNNDFSDGVPEMLKGLEQVMMPPAGLGWATRLKSQHFAHYQNVAQEFANQFGLDFWQLAPLFDYCDEIDFMTRVGEDCLASHVDTLLTKIKQKYQQYQIDSKPFVVVKADAGTYGMAVMTVYDVDEIRNLNRKQRTKMATIKGGKSVNRVIIQEGVYTSETFGEKNAVAEPVVYMIGRHVVGGFYRVHAGRGDTESLNAPGMEFEQLAFATACNNPRYNGNCELPENRFYIYGVIARLALVAAAREMAKVKEQVTCL